MLAYVEILAWPALILMLSILFRKSIVALLARFERVERIEVGGFGANVAMLFEGRVSEGLRQVREEVDSVVSEFGEEVEPRLDRQGIEKLLDDAAAWGWILGRQGTAEPPTPSV